MHSIEQLWLCLDDLAQVDDQLLLKHRVRGVYRHAQFEHYLLDQRRREGFRYHMLPVTEHTEGYLGR